MPRSLPIALLAIGLGTTSLVGGTAEPPRAAPTATELMVSETLGRARAELARLEESGRSSQALMQALMQRATTLSGYVKVQPGLAESLMAVDSTAWSMARSAWSGRELEKFLEGWQRELADMLKKSGGAGNESKALQNAIKQAQRVTSTFDKTAPARPKKQDWEQRRDRLMAVVQAQMQALLQLEGANTALISRLNQELATIDQRKESIERLLRTLEPSPAERSPRELP